MKDVETRQVNRDSLFLLAQLRVNGNREVFRVKVRNLSAGGMMAEGVVPVSRGQAVAVELRNIGWVNGSVAWKQDDRFGIAFQAEIDPRLARAPLTNAAPSPISQAHRPPLSAQAVPAEKLRKL
jgi:hypothetical protein